MHSRPLSSLLPLVGAVLLSLSAAPASASHIGESLSVDQQYVSANDQLLNALSQWEKMPASVRDARAAQLAALAAHRQEHLLLLLQKNPKVAAARMMPKELRDRLPAQAAAYVEREVALQGTVFANISDNFAQGVSQTSFKFQPGTGGAAMNLDLADALATERDMLSWAGKKLSLKGMQIADHLALLDKSQVQLMAAGSTTTTTSTSTVSASSTAIQGDQKTLSILVNFADKAVSCTASDVASRLFGTTGATVNNNYKESSRGLVSFSGQAVGPFTIPYTSTGTCDYSSWATAAEAAAKAAGIDPSLYAHVNYVTPSNSTCGWTGLAYMPGRQSWVQACTSTGTYSHELGHNLSFNHAATPTNEYGDSSDPMGGARLVDHNGANRTMAGWMPAGTVSDVSSGGSYSLTTVSNITSVGTAQVLRFVKADTSEFYYVSVREAMNLDSGVGAPYVDTISIHRATGTLPTKTYLLQNLAAGQSYTDATNGITITNQGISSGVATVGVTMSGAVCTRVAPSVSVSPASQTASPGTARSYTVTVHNNNPSACGTSSFNLRQAMPSGFTGSLSTTTLSLGAGANGTATLTDASSTSTVAGTYTIDAVATDAANTAYTTTTHASYVVYSGDTTPPTLSITSPTPGLTTTISGKSSLTISATASDASGIKLVEFYGDGKLLAQDTAAPYTTSWNLRKLSTGVHTVMVRATDNAGNVTQQSTSFSVN
jgi:hypothetical protein